MSTCRSCGAEIVWAVTATGKRMPVDAATHPDGNVQLDRDHATVLGPLDRLFAADQGADLHMPHHATCPDANDWRNR